MQCGHTIKTHIAPRMQWGWSPMCNHPFGTINLFSSNRNGIRLLFFFWASSVFSFHAYKILCEDIKRPNVAPFKTDNVPSPKTNDSEDSATAIFHQFVGKYSCRTANTNGYFDRNRINNKRKCFSLWAKETMQTPTMIQISNNHYLQ